MIRYVIIEGYNEIFEVKKDMTHRSRNYLKLYTEYENLKEVQFNSIVKESDRFQMGYDLKGEIIYIKLVDNDKK